MQPNSPYYMNSPENKIALQYLFTAVPYIDGLTTAIQSCEDTIKKYLTKKNVEIEAKFGFFIPKNSEEPIAKQLGNTRKLTVMDFKNEKKKSSFIFNAKIPIMLFNLIKRALEERCTHKDQQLVFLGEFTIKDTTNKKKVRYSEIYDQSGKLVNTEIISKQNRTDINIFNFGNDFRITLCEERPQQKPNDLDKNSYCRNKKRYRFRYQFMEFDLTMVDSSSGHELEVEIEITDPLFFSNQIEGINKDENELRACNIEIEKAKLILNAQMKKANLSKFITQYFYNVASISKILEYPQIVYDYFFLKFYGPGKPLVGQYIIEEQFNKANQKDAIILQTRQQS